MNLTYKKYIKNIIFLYLSIPIIIAIVLYPILPIILNYPPNSIDNLFQKELEGLTYTPQYIMLIFVMLICDIFILLYRSYKLFKYFNILQNKKINDEEINIILFKIRNFCLNTPYLLYYIQIIIPIIFLPITFLLINANIITIVKICTVYISFFTLASVISFVFSKNEFKKIIVLLHNAYADNMVAIELVYSNIRKHKKNKSLPFKLMMQLTPFIILCLVFTSLLGYIQASKEINQVYYNFYYNILNNSLDNTLNNHLELQKALSNISIVDNTTAYFIINEDGTYITSDNRILSNFFIKYTIEEAINQNGHTYDYFGLNSAGIMRKYQTIDESTYYIGFIYGADLKSFYNFIVLSDIILFIITDLILYYISLSLTKDIKSVTIKLQEIAFNNKNSINLSDSLAITSEDELSDLTLAFNSIQQLIKNNIDIIQSNQSRIIEQERLASLGQMIGGIAHNLKTPIMSIAGAAEALNDLTMELDNSIGNPVVTNEDFHDIAKDYISWINKIKDYTEYMSDIITAVKGQAVNLTNDAEINFTIAELFKRVDILMKHELKSAIIYLQAKMLMDDKTIIKGDVNSLVQVINNMISNAIQAYNGKTEETIELIAKIENNHVIISVIDHACGLPEKVQKKLFKEMITTKGKNGTGLGLYMSYSTIKAHFNGNITFKSEENKGTQFDIIIPL